MLKKKATLRYYSMVMKWLICIVIWGSLTGQCYVDEVLHLHVFSIYWTAGNNFLSQQENVPIPAIWQGTSCKLVASWSCRTLLTGLVHLQSTTLGILETGRYMTCIPSQLSHYPYRKTSWLNNVKALSTQG